MHLCCLYKGSTDTSLALAQAVYLVRLVARSQALDRAAMLESLSECSEPHMEELTRQ